MMGKVISSGRSSTFICIVFSIICLSFVYLIVNYTATVDKNIVLVHGKDLLIKISQNITNSISDTLLSSDSNDDIQYEVCAFTVPRKELHLLPQWLEFNFVAGFDQIFIVNNCIDSEEMKKRSFWLDFYKQIGFVTLVTENIKCNKKENDKNEYYYTIQKMIKKCNWIIDINTDEYIFPSDEDELTVRRAQLRGSITNQTEILPFIKKFVTNSTSQVHRLPMYSMSNHKLESKPDGIILDNYMYGQFNGKVKLIVNSDYIKKYDGVKKSFELKKVDGNLDSLDTKQSELVPLSAERSSCLLPSTQMFIKHYDVFSWEEYSALFPNETRETWLKYYYKRRCPLISDKARKRMTKLIYDSFKDKAMSNNSTEITDFDNTILVKWLNSDIL